MVVERKIARRHMADAAAELGAPMPRAQLLGRGVQTGLIDRAGPEAVEGCLQFAPRADTRKAEIAGDGHASSPASGAPRPAALVGATVAGLLARGLPPLTLPSRNPRPGFSGLPARADGSVACR